jgi:hypothetical protein
MTDTDDTTPNFGYMRPIAPQIDPRDGGVVTSITDPERIAEFDKQGFRSMLSGGRISPSDNGYSYQLIVDELGRDVYVLFNPGGDNCGVRRSLAKAEAWCNGEGSVA